LDSGSILAEAFLLSDYPRADEASLRESCHACLENAKRLLEDGEWCSNRPSTGLALVMLAQEECAKAFILILVHTQIIPWCDEVRRSLRIHNCKYVVLVFMEWLAAKHTIREAAWLGSQPQPTIDSSGLPPEVAKAINIYRHEMLEDRRRSLSIPYPEWNGVARKTAEGKNDHRKQDALYIGIGRNGEVTSRPPTSIQEFEKELSRAKEIIAFTDTVQIFIPFDFPEYEHFKEVFGSVFTDLDPDFNKALVEESFPSDIPGIALVRRMITVADVIDENASPEMDGKDSEKL
jgi:AbiV family abortive infection protein